MDVVSLGPLPATSIIWQPRPGAFVLTVVAKATFAMRPGELALTAVQDPPAAEDRHLGDDAARPLVRPRDLVPAKPLADVVLVGSAFAPDRRPARSLLVRLAVGEVDKSIEVVADRWFSASGAAVEGSPFVQMPLTYERAAGGPGTWNPAGLARGARDAEGRLAIPNLQRPGSQPGAIEPIGFGPIAAFWPERRDRLVGAAFSLRDLAIRPLPEGMDLGYFNVAPRDQVLRAFGPSEVILLEHLHPEHPRLSMRLPGLVPRATLEGRRGGPVHVTMRADTLWIDTDHGVLAVTFRGLIPLESADEQGRVTVTMERAAAEAPSVHRAPEAPAPSAVARARREPTVDPPLSARQAAVLPFAKRPSETPRPDPPVHAPPRSLSDSPWANPSLILEAAAAPVPHPPTRPAPSAPDAPSPPAVPTEAPPTRPAAEPEGPRAEARESVELLWFDPESVPRLRRKPAWRALLDAAERAPTDPDLDDAAPQPTQGDDGRVVFELLARGEPLDLAALDAAFVGCQRDDGRFVSTVALFAGELETPFDELAALRATLSTVTPLAGADEALRGALEAAKELLALPDLMAAPAVAEGLSRRIEQAFAQAKRAVPADYLDAQRERVLLELRKYQRRAVLGDRHLRALLRFDGEGPRPGRKPLAVPVYLPEATAALLPLSPRFRARFVAEIRLAADPGEGHPAALRALALARAVRR